MDAIKTAYSTAYARLLLMLKGNKIGNVVSVETTCTSLANSGDAKDLSEKWNSLCAWGPTALLPIFQILGTKYKSKQIVSMFADENKTFDLFTKINFIFEDSTASLKVGKGIKSEGEMIISGTKGYVYVPAPWWKTDYFEVRYENSNENKRYFYQLDGEGIRYEIVSFLKAIESGFINNVPEDVSIGICAIMESFNIKENLEEIDFANTP
jgi:choline-phosphate cytidylyltransferase